MKYKYYVYNFVYKCPQYVKRYMYLLGYNAMQSVESQPTFRRNMPPPSPGSALLATCLYAGFLLGLFFDPEDQGNRESSEG
jgi:hypothetical protein